MTAPLIVRIDVSAALCAAVSLLHGVAGLCALVALDGAPLLLVIVGIGTSALAQLRALRAGARNAAIEMACHADGRVTLTEPSAEGSSDGDATRAELRLEQGAVLAPWLVVLSLRDSAGRRRTLTLVPGSAHADALRRLRVWIRWHHAHDGAHAALN